MVLPIPRRLGWVSFERRLQKGGYGSSQSVKESPNGLRRVKVVVEVEKTLVGSWRWLMLMHLHYASGGKILMAGEKIKQKQAG